MEWQVSVNHELDMTHHKNQRNISHLASNNWDGSKPNKGDFDLADG